MKAHPLKLSLMVLLCLVLLLSGCGPSEAEIQVTQQVAKTQTQAARPSATSSQTVVPTGTPYYMNTDSIVDYLEQGFKISNRNLNEKMRGLAASYTGRESNAPTTLKIKVQYQSDVYTSGCLMPVAIVSWGILDDNSVSVFPASLEKIIVECYDPDSDLLMSYEVSMDYVVELVDAEDLGGFGPEQIMVLQYNMPPTGTPIPAESPTPRPTYTRVPTRTATPKPVVVVPTSVGGDFSGASAICKDGTYSYSRHRSGTCAGHDGVLRWLKNLPP